MRLMDIKILLFMIYVVSGCPSGWVTYDASCYLFSTDMENWPSAETMCRLMGGYLVVIDDMGEGKFLSDRVTATKHQSWIALSDVYTEGRFVWFNADGTTTRPGYTNWAPGQPNNLGGSQDCVGIGHTGQWWDRHCSDIGHYICEKEDALEIIG